VSGRVEEEDIFALEAPPFARRTDMGFEREEIRLAERPMIVFLDVSRSSRRLAML
jgi:hypothetical protein